MCEFSRRAWVRTLNLHSDTGLSCLERMTMADVFEAINDLIKEHWVKALTGIAFAIAGWWIARFRANRQWQQREFFHRINFSLNSIVDGILQIRTLSEKTCDEVFLNEAAVKQLVKAAQETKPGLPLIPLPKKDCWFFLNAALNEMSEQFAVGLLKREAGKTVSTEQYVLCLTNECDGEVRTHKVRAQVIRKSLLLELPEKRPQFESKQHVVRWETLMYLSLIHI